MAFEELFKIYPNKNIELKAIAKTAYEFGKNIAQEPSAGMSLGLDIHAIQRQKEYVLILTSMVEAIHARPVPDMPYVHPTRFDINFTEPYKQFTKDGIVLNEDTQLLAEYWMVIAVELSASQSAGLAGSLTDADHRRAVNHIGVITQYLTEMEKRPIADIPETAFPGAGLEVPTEGKEGKPGSNTRK